MKKICTFLCCLMSFCAPYFLPENMSGGLFQSIETAQAIQTSPTYAKALSNCALYKDKNLSPDISNIKFVVPETYFVLVAEVLSDRCMRVFYDKYEGYVDSSTVVIATFVPVQKTLEGITCDVKEVVGTQIWSLPSASSGSVPYTEIQGGTKNLRYIASVFGTVPSGGESNLWYYVSYTPSYSETSVFEGYIYSENITYLPEIPTNTESNPEQFQDGEDPSDGEIAVSTPVRTLIIAIIAIPIILLFAIILYKIVKKVRENTFKKNYVNEENLENFGGNGQYNANGYGGYGYDEPQIERPDLHSQIDRMKHTSFVKKRALHPSRYHRQQQSFPEFPTYESDDDLL